MSDAVGATAAPTTSTNAPAGKAEPFARAEPAPKPDGVLSKKDAADFLAKRRAEREKAAAAENNLRLVPAHEDTTSDESAPEDTAATPQATEGADSEGNEQAEEAEPEQVPTWAQKLKAEHAQATEKVQALEKRHAERDAQFAEAHQRVKYALDDVNADLKAEQSYSAALEKAIAAAGLAIPADWKARIAAERERDRLKMQLERGQSTTKSFEKQQAEKRAGEQVQTVLADLAKKIPEFDLAKNPETKAWLQARFALDDNGKPVNPGAFKTLEADAIAFAKALRWDRTQKANAGKKPLQPKPNESQRPSSTTLSGKGGGTSAARAPAVPKNEKESLAWLQARKATRK